MAHAGATTSMYWLVTTHQQDYVAKCFPVIRTQWPGDHDVDGLRGEEDARDGRGGRGTALGGEHRTSLSPANTPAG